jgi:predicted nucleic acid-binding protein
MSDKVEKALLDDPEISVWWGTLLECVSAVARAEREGGLTAQEVVEALGELDRLNGSWFEIEPDDRIRDNARRLLLVHSLRAADALQLAAAISAADGQPSSIEFVTLDNRLKVAARREGFPVPDLSGAL